MPLKRLIFTKVDNGSSSEWERWDRKKTISGNSIFSMGKVYCVTEERTDENLNTYWRLFYRLGSEDIDLPSIFKEEFRSQDSLKDGVDKFGSWAYDNQVKLVESHERYCDGI